MSIFLFAFLLITFLSLTIEIIRLKRSIKHIPVRILVNGTRGKTSTVRMMYRIFLENKYKVNAKTTGEEPVLWKSNGQSELLHRFAPANIIENLRIIRDWAGKNTQVAVLECMALHPEMQHTLAWKIFDPTHTFITNIGNDHFEVMGKNLQEITETILQSSTNKNILFIPAEYSNAKIEAGRIETYNPEKSPVDDIPIPPVVLDSHWGLIHVFIDHFGLDFETGVKIFRQEWMRNVEQMRYVNNQKNYTFWNLFSVNDSDSAAYLLAHIMPEIKRSRSCITIFNARRDRPLRTESFASMMDSLPSDTVVWIMGSGTCLCRRLFRKNLPGRKIELISIRKIIKIIEAGFKVNTCLIGLGNTRGIQTLLKGFGQE